MNPRDFLDTAADLASGDREADWRSCISRSYYAVYHTLRGILTTRVDVRLLVLAGNRKPQHDFIARSLRNSDDEDVRDLGHFVDELKNERHRADYELDMQTTRSKATTVMGDARDLVGDIDGLGAARIAATVTELLRRSPYGYRQAPGDSD